VVSLIGSSLSGSIRAGSYFWCATEAQYRKDKWGKCSNNCPKTKISNVRLVGGNNDLEGRVEIFYNGNWGTVCDDGWDLNAGKVVCKMLGYGLATSAPVGASFGQGTGEIMVDNIRCSGTESELSQCGYSGLGNHNCRHREDAGVVCSAN
jgi:deleted-in-malignant-brain-tumors protein 1